MVESVLCQESAFCDKGSYAIPYLVPPVTTDINSCCYQITDTRCNYSWGSFYRVKHLGTRSCDCPHVYVPSVCHNQNGTQLGHTSEQSAHRNYICEHITLLIVYDVSSISSWAFRRIFFFYRLYTSALLFLGFSLVPITDGSEGIFERQIPPSALNCPSLLWEAFSLCTIMSCPS